VKKIIVNIANKAELFAAYMPWIQHGGLFVSTTDPYRLGDRLLLDIENLCEIKALKVIGKVVWLTPMQTELARSSGIGVQFIDEHAHFLQEKIEETLTC
jgi:type IV pilus assembly protein PilZ